MVSDKTDDRNAVTRKVLAPRMLSFTLQTIVKVSGNVLPTSKRRCVITSTCGTRQ